MSTSSKTRPNARPKRTSKALAAPLVKRSVKAPRQAPKPYLRFYHSESLRSKTLSVLKALENARDATQHRDALADVVVELTDSGMDYFFLRPLKIAKAGFFVEQSANLGIAATTGVLGSVIRNIIGRMDEPQLLSVCGYIRQLME